MPAATALTEENGFSSAALEPWERHGEDILGIRFLNAGDRFALLELCNSMQLDMNLRAIQLADRLLEGPQSPSHRRLALPQRPRRRAERARPRDGEENPKVTPFHPPASAHSIMNGIRAASLVLKQANCAEITMRKTERIPHDHDEFDDCSGSGHG